MRTKMTNFPLDFSFLNEAPGVAADKGQAPAHAAPVPVPRPASDVAPPLVVELRPLPGLGE